MDMQRSPRSDGEKRPEGMRFVRRTTRAAVFFHPDCEPCVAVAKHGLTVGSGLGPDLLTFRHAAPASTRMRHA
jgi:hypothetical protein